MIYHCIILSKSEQDPRRDMNIYNHDEHAVKQQIAT
jgi:hypothetical protein